MVTQIWIYCFGILDLIYTQEWIDLQHIDFVNCITIDGEDMMYRGRMFQFISGDIIWRANHFVLFKKNMASFIYQWIHLTYF